MDSRPDLGIFAGMWAAENRTKEGIAWLLETRSQIVGPFWGISKALLESFYVICTSHEKFFFWHWMLRMPEARKRMMHWGWCLLNTKVYRAAFSASPLRRSLRGIGRSRSYRMVSTVNFLYSFPRQFASDHWRRACSAGWTFEKMLGNSLACHRRRQMEKQNYCGLYSAKGTLFCSILSETNSSKWELKHWGKSSWTPPLLCDPDELAVERFHYWEQETVSDRSHKEQFEILS